MFLITPVLPRPDNDARHVGGSEGHYTVVPSWLSHLEGGKGEIFFFFPNINKRHVERDTCAVKCSLLVCLM